MSSSEKFCLKWNDFQENISSSFGSLKEDSDFTDVTLACEDGQQIEAHKVILAASSPFFQNLLKKNKHAHPLVYMRGMKSGDLLAIVDFMYDGEANVYQENLDVFLAIAEELKLKGLIGDDKNEQKKEFAQKHTRQSNESPIIKAENKTDEDHPNFVRSQDNFQVQVHAINKENVKDHTVAILSGSTDFLELDTQIKSMIGSSQNTMSNGKIKAYLCKVCGKEAKYQNIKDHIEAHHIEGLCLPCNSCEKTFRSRNAMSTHISRSHNQSIK